MLLKVQVQLIGQVQFAIELEACPAAFSPYHSRRTLRSIAKAKQDVIARLHGVIADCRKTSAGKIAGHCSDQTAFAGIDLHEHRPATSA
nr:hypothetical protein [Novosphingobium ginsenosidimutans]